MVVVLSSRKQKQSHTEFQEKLDHLLHNHHHHRQKAEEDESVALQGFRSQLSSGVRDLIASSNNGVTFSWLEQCLKLLDVLDNGLLRLIEALDCPMAKWGSALVDEYLSYTLNLLDALNSVTSALTHLQGVRLSLAHTLTSPSSSAMGMLSFADHHGRTFNWAAEQEEYRLGLGESQGNERLVKEAVVEMKAVALWVCRVVLSGLGGEKVNKDDAAMEVPPFIVDLDLREDFGELVEVKEMNEMLSGILADATLVDREDELKEMQTKLEMYRTKLEEAVEVVNCLFAQVLASRNKLMDCFRLQKE